MQVSVILKGRLRGMGREASCEVMAKRQAPAGTGKEGYSDLRLLEAPGDWPDGDYVLHLDPVMVSVRRRGGEWLLGNELLKEHKLSQTAATSSFKA
jgi:hypothetical protein